MDRATPVDTARPSEKSNEGGICSGDVCTAKVLFNWAHQCGTAPGTGSLKFTNVGVHIVAAFTFPAGKNLVAWDSTVNGAEKFANQYVENVPVSAASSLQLSALNVVVALSRRAQRY